MKIFLGNVSARQERQVGVQMLDGSIQMTVMVTEIPGQFVTTYSAPEHKKIQQCFTEITGRPGTVPTYQQLAPKTGAWFKESTKAPQWVWGEDIDKNPEVEDLVNRLAAHYGCTIGRPPGWE